MASSKPFMFLFLISFLAFLGIFWNPSPLSYAENEVTSSSENNDLKLKSTVAALKESIIKGKLKEVRTKEEKIQSVKDASEAEGTVYDKLQKQIFELKQEVEMQRKRSLEVETRAEIADTKVSELNSKLENIDGKWLLSKLCINPNKTMTYVMTLWHQHVSQTLQKKWIPCIKDSYVTLTIYFEPKVQYLTQGFDVSYYYLKVIQIMTITKPHLEKVQVVLEPCTKIIRQGFNKLVEVLRRNNEIK